MTQPFLSTPLRRPSAVVFPAVAIAAALLLTGCGNKNKDKTATQAAAKVNKEEITVHQINFLLGQQRAVAPDQAASAGRVALERLIDQELALQKATEQKLDREPRVVQLVEAARRDIIVRAYADKIGEGAPKATPQEVSAYYDAHPALFGARRLYSLQEVSIDAAPDQIEGVRAALAQAKTFPDFIAFLKDKAFKYAGSEAVRAAEQIPMEDVDKLAALKDGQSIFSVRPGGAQVVYLARSRPQPVTEEQARPAIEKFLLNERKRRLIADDLQALRGAAKVEYVGQFAEDAARAPYVPPALPSLSPVKTLAPTLPAPAVTATPQVDVARPDERPASMPSGETLDKGLKGLK